MPKSNRRLIVAAALCVLAVGVGAYAWRHRHQWRSLSMPGGTHSTAVGSQPSIAEAFSIEAMAFTTDGSTLITAGIKIDAGGTGVGHGFLQLRDATADHVTREIPGIDGRVQALSLSPDESILAVGVEKAGGAGEILLLDWPAATISRHISCGRAPVSSLCFSADSTQLLAAAGDISLWDARSGQLIRTFRDDSSDAAAPFFQSATISSDGSWVAGAARDGSIRRWNAKNGKLVDRLAGHLEMAVAAVFTPDSATLITAGWSLFPSGPRGDLLWWDMATGKIRARVSAHGRIQAISLSRDGSILTTAGGVEQPEVMVWDAIARTPRDTLQFFAGEYADPAEAVALSPDGTRLAYSLAHGAVLTHIIAPSAAATQPGL